MAVSRSGGDTRVQTWRTVRPLMSRSIIRVKKLISQPVGNAVPTCHWLLAWLSLLPWKRRQDISPKRRQNYARLHTVTCHVLSIARTPNYNIKIASFQTEYFLVLHFLFFFVFFSLFPTPFVFFYHLMFFSFFGHFSFYETQFSCFFYIFTFVVFCFLWRRASLLPLLSSFSCCSSTMKNGLPTRPLRSDCDRNRTHWAQRPRNSAKPFGYIQTGFNSICRKADDELFFYLFAKFLSCSHSDHWRTRSHTLSLSLSLSLFMDLGVTREAASCEATR
jgi:hypothetical protein